MKPHYFEQDEADTDDLALTLAKGQGYVPVACLLGGHVVTGLVLEGKKPCAGCNGPRERCGGPVSAVARPESSERARLESRAAKTLFEEGFITYGEYAAKLDDIRATEGLPALGEGP